jgi:serine/threonine protein kinase
MKEMSETQLGSLLQALGRLHRFKIIHRDINPSNIMFSPKRNSLVFIDFGFSLIVPEDQGFKSSTTFHGTPAFVSREMFQLFNVKSSEA